MRRRWIARALVALLLMTMLTAVDSSRPASAASFAKGASVNGGHACSIDSDGAAFCWGANTNGQLGNGTTTSSLIPVAVSGGLSFKSIVTSFDASCGLTDSGAAYCWGRGSEVGDGTGFRRTTPVAVVGGHSFAIIAGGYENVCAVTTGGVAYCWGRNFEGGFGNGTTSGSLSPTAVSGGLVFSTISVGVSFTCGITTGNAAYCWGQNSNGQLGTGNTTASLTPVAVSGGLSFAGISAGESHACAVTTSGDGYCWGLNTDLQLGSTGTHTSPALVSGGLGYTSISTGRNVSCGLTTANTIYCWGQGFQWRALGDSTNSARSTPGIINGGRTYSSLGTTTGYAQGFCAVSSNGPLYCWGKNDTGQLGIGNTDIRIGPTQTWLITGVVNSTTSATVDPSLTFSVSGHSGSCNGVAQSSGATSSGTAIALGRINPANGVGAQDLVVSTNAANGFAVYARSTGALSNPTHDFAGVPGSNASPGAFPASGTEGFGYTTSDATLVGGTANRFTNGGAKWAAITTTDAEVSAAVGSVSADAVCVAFQAGVGATTPAGAYSTNVIYTAVARF